LRVLGDVLRLNAKRYPEKNALIMGNRHLSYRQLNQRVNRLAHGFLTLGIQKEDRVAILGNNSLEWVVAAYAAVKCGAVIVPVNFRYQTDELIYVINSSMPDLLVTGPDCIPLVQDALPAFSRPIKTVTMGPEPLPSGTTCEALMQGAPTSEPSIEVEPDQPTAIIYTSGTTGMPKGVLMSHASYLNIYTGMVLEGDMRHEDIMMVPLV